MGFYREFVKELKDICSKRGFLLEEIGFYNSRKNYPLYKVTLNPDAQRAICFSCGIHGEEVAGPYASLKFLNRADTEKFRNTKVVIFPLISPVAFNNGKRHSADSEDANGLFCRQKLTGVNRIVYNSIKNEKLLFFNAFHEDINEDRFYLFNHGPTEDIIHREIIELARKSFPIIDNGKIFEGDTAINGIIQKEGDGSFEDRMAKDGVPYSLCTETPMKKFNLSKRIKLNVAIMNKIIDFAGLI